MFERYSEHARRVIFLARYEASVFGSPYIETHHILLGVVRESPDALTPFVESAEQADAIRRELTERFPAREQISTSVDLPLSHEARRVLAYSAEEAERLHHPIIGCRHLVVGLLREQNCVAAEILRRYGATVEQMRDRPGHTPVRNDVESLGRALAKVPEERLEAAALILAALAEPTVSISFTTPRERRNFEFGPDTPTKS